MFLSKARMMLASLFLALSTFGVVSQASVLDEIDERGVLRVAVPQDFPPFGSVGTDMQPEGYDIDVARYIADAMGVELELTPVTSANRIPYLQTGRVDLVISSMGKTPEREEAIDFSIAYAPFFLGVFGLEELPVSSAADLDDQTVGTTRGAIEDLELTEVAPDSTTIRRFEDNNATISAFLSGQVDLIATGNLVAASIIDRNPNRAPETKFLLQDSPCHVGIPQGDERLQAAVNEIIAEGISSGDFDELSEQWFGQPLPDSLKDA